MIRRIINIDEEKCNNCGLCSDSKTSFDVISLIELTSLDLVFLVSSSVSMVGSPVTFNHTK